MKTIALLGSLHHLGVRLWADGDHLCYRAPQGTLTPALRAELAERKADILAFLHEANLAARSTLPHVFPVSRDGNLPLSFAQQHLWFLDQLAPSNPAYNIPVAYRITGRLNVMALEQSLGEIVRRHEILRTTFSVMAGQPVQVIAPALAVPLSVVDLRDLSETQREAETQRLATEEAQQSFDLTRGPLLRVKLFRLAEAEHVLLLTMHHIISDMWSIGILSGSYPCSTQPLQLGSPRHCQS